jgi:hypothetical protein
MVILKRFEIRNVVYTERYGVLATRKINRGSMKKLAFLLLLQLMFNSCNSQNQDIIINQKLDEIVQEYFDNHDFIGAVFIANNGDILLKKGYGYADIENKIQNTPSTNFFIGSISKLFTIACISDLIDRELLEYDTPLSKYIPDYPNGEDITIEHLIKHKSGIVDVVNEKPYVFKKTFTNLTELIEEFKYLPLNFSPGERYQYSNSGYILLSFIIEKVSGLNYSDFVKINIFDKLNMKNSFSLIDSLPVKQSKGYSKVEDKFIPSEYFHPSQFVGSGNISSTLEDMYRWYNGLYKTRKISVDNQSIAYGRIDGWTHTAFLFHEYADYVIIILSNFGDAPVTEMGKKLTDELFNSFKTHNTLMPIDLKSFEGFYDYGNYGIQAVSERDGSLYVQLSGQDEFEIYPISKNCFLLKVINAKIKFENNSKEIYAMHSQNGLTINAPKIKTPKLSTTELSNIVGKYDYGSEGILNIRELNGRLFAKLSNQSEFEIFPISSKEFYWMVVNARIKFESNAQGVIINAIHYQGGQKLKAPKINE